MLGGTYVLGHRFRELASSQTLILLLHVASFAVPGGAV